MKEDNIFLAGEKRGLASGIRKEFKETDEGNKRVDGWFVSFYGA